MGQYINKVAFLKLAEILVNKSYHVNPTFEGCGSVWQCGDLEFLYTQIMGLTGILYPEVLGVVVGVGEELMRLFSYFLFQKCKLA